jgi:uroporphyrinogen-III synthase
MAPPAPLRIWVTRTQPGADATAARLSHLGHVPVVAPVLQARALVDPTPAMTGVDALAFTSAAAVRMFAALTPDLGSAGRDPPAFCVGEATAAAARRAGLSAVTSAGGDVATLAALIAATVPTGATVLHPCARETAGDLTAPLAASGVTLRQAPIYQTEAVKAPPPEIADLLRADRLDAVLVHSPKAARVTAALLAPLPPATLARLQAFAISPAALAPLQALPFFAAAAAATPDETALLKLLRR